MLGDGFWQCLHLTYGTLLPKSEQTDLFHPAAKWTLSNRKKLSRTGADVVLGAKLDQSRMTNFLARDFLAKNHA